MGRKSFVQIEINAVFTTTSGKMQVCSGVFDHFNHYLHNLSLSSQFFIIKIYQYHRKFIIIINITI
jgi:hypothetical protein